MTTTVEIKPDIAHNELVHNCGLKYHNIPSTRNKIERKSAAYAYTRVSPSLFNIMCWKKSIVLILISAKNTPSNSVIVYLLVSHISDYSSSFNAVNGKRWVLDKLATIITPQRSK